METIVLGIGETLVRDDRRWSSWADWLGVPPHTLSALVGAAVAQGHDATDALRTLRPGMDVEAAYRARSAAGRGEHLDESDLYQDVRPALGELRAAGVRVVVAGNGSARAGELLRALDLPADLVVTSAEWGVRKPDPEFFARVAAAAEAPPAATLYVGDHPADDLFPAAAAGLRTAHLRRGPYGHWWADHPDVVETAEFRIDALTELVALVRPPGAGAEAAGAGAEAAGAAAVGSDAEGAGGEGPGEEEAGGEETDAAGAAREGARRGALRSVR
ncbi:HAD family hydrolase [Streptomyces californicus]|uniref:HAD family hydrolase n=1 Tax=Streptomyces californicus TaxID=67351 RepID=UPI001E2C80C0|nr:HAD-IA family hydrolase [Streptomyces californicus]MCC0580542.1 HAD-IA family hydrolase [Streptomyces californicus]